MRRTRFDDWPCPIARVTDLVGDWWTPLVMREAFLGRRRFDDFQEALGVSRPVLTQRLNRLIDEGMLERRPYQENPPRYEYRLTDKGRDFWGVLAAMWRFGDDWQFGERGAPDGNPLMMIDRETGEEIRPIVVNELTGEPLDVRRSGLRLVDDTTHRRR